MLETKGRCDPTESEHASHSSHREQRCRQLDNTRNVAEEHNVQSYFHNLIAVPVIPLFERARL